MPSSAPVCKFISCRFSCSAGDLVYLGMNLLTPNGFLCYITSNKWMRAGYGEALRGYFASKTNPIMLVDFAGIKIFDAITVEAN